MYQNNCGCNGGLGFITEALSVFDSLTGGGGGATGGAPGTPGATGGAGGATGPITVSPAISTQISPQISPIFQQQFQPSNSAATAGTAQSLPAMPALNTGTAPTLPGEGQPGYYPASGPVSAPLVPAVPETGTDWARYMPYALAGLGILAFVSLKKRGQK